MDDQQIPLLCRAKIARQRDEAFGQVDVRRVQPVGSDDVEDERDEAVEVFAAGDASALALVDDASLDLLLARRSAIAPKSLDRFARFVFVVC